MTNVLLYLRIYLIFDLQSVLTKAAGTPDYWFKGCYRQILSTQLTNFTEEPQRGKYGHQGPAEGDITNSWTIPTKCAESCLQNGSVFTLVQCGHCLCVNETTSFEERPGIICEGQRLQCGTEEAWALYSTSGPFISQLTAKVDGDWLAVAAPVVLDVTVQLEKLINVSETLANVTWPLDVNITWVFQDDSFTSVTVDATGESVYSRVKHSFTDWGPQVIDVCATTLVSKKCEVISVNVLYPSPRDLQLLTFALQSDQPSCLPYDIRLPDSSQQFAVFKDATFTLEATVAIGTNLTFTFDLLSEDNVYVSKTNGTEDCSENGCLKAARDYTFSKVGLYDIHVTVDNQYGVVSKNITVAVVERELSNLIFTSNVKAVVTPGHIIGFHVVVTLTSRINGLLTVHFGDGDSHEAKLEDTNSTSFALQCTQGQMLVVSSYGNGCDLNIEFSHAFSGEGTYKPEVIVKSEGMALTSSISSGTITVMNRLTGARIQSDKSVAVNKSVEFVLHLTSRSEAMEVTWVIGDTSNGEMLNKTSADTHLSYTFTSPGVYQVTAEAKNLISRARATSHVTVQVPIINAFLSCGHVTYISTGEEIECICDIFEGTDAKFEWNFQDPGAGKVAGIRREDLSSTVNYTYHRPGQYNISVLAYNEISKTTTSLPSVLRVLKPVTCVAIQSSGPTKLGNPVHFMVIICQGTTVRLEFDFGQGRQKHGYELYDIPGEFYSSYDFKEPGIHDVTIFAYNRVSEVSHTTQVLVQDRIPDVQLLTLNNKAVVGAPMTIIVTVSGKQLQRKDLVYTWKFQDGRTVMSSVPFWNGVIAEEGKLIVNFTAHNFVDAVQIHHEIDMESDPGPLCYVDHPPAISRGQTVSFKPKISGKNGFNIDFGNGKTEYFAGSANSKLHHLYDIAGQYRVTVKCTGETERTKTWTSLIMVDVPITGLQIEGPTVVEIEKLLRDYMWKASVSTGTNIVYTWETGVGVVNNTTLSMFMKGFSKPGTYPITVKAHNSVSQMEASVNITVQYPILDMMVTIDPTVLNQSSVINISVHGGREFFIQIDFGDGSFLHTSSDRLSEAELSTPRRGSYVPEYSVLINHVYPEIKTYEVTINISNMISSLVKSKMAIVDTPISGIELTTESPPVVSPEDAVVVMVTVAKGNDLRFKWDFSDKYNPDLDIKSTANCSIATHTFSVVGHWYQVSVSISSPYYKEPIIVRLPFKFHVVESIGDVTLDVIGGQYGAPLTGVGPDQSTAEIEFKAMSESGTDVEFLFDFGDGSRSMVTGYEAFPFYHFKGTACHRYVNEGAYNVTVTAINPLGNVTAFLEELFVVQTPSIGLRLEKSKYATRIGEVTTLRAYHSGGTNVTFDWKLGDQSDVIRDGGPVINHMYKNPGVYDIVVMLRNQVSNQTYQAKVFVQQELQGVHINVSQDSRIYAVGDQVEFTASVFPESATVMYYKWSLGEEPDTKLSYKDTFTHIYRRYGTFIVTVKAHNFVSQVNSPPFQVKVMSKVKNLKIVFNDDPIVNTTLTFTAFHYSGSDLTYTWDFGDFRGEVVTNDYREEIKHTYTSIREYFVTLTAENAISKDVTSLHLFVLDRVCKTPEVQLHGHTRERISRSDSLYVETRIKSIQCDYSTKASFLWSIYNQTSGESIQLNAGDRNALQQKNLYLPPWTLFVGKYWIVLRVQVKETIVYTTHNMSLEVVPRLVRAVIKGGLMREITRQDTVVLDAKNTLGYNHNNGSDLSFNWICSTTLKENKPVNDCFNVTRNILLNSSLVTFQASILNTDKKDFLFTLKVKGNNQESEATQVIQLKDVDDQNLKLSIHCAQCDSGLVNTHQHLRLQAVCYKCRLKDMEFDWSIQMLVEGATDVNSNILDTSCLKDDTSSYWSFRADNDSNVSTNQNKGISEPTTTTIDTTSVTSKPVFSDYFNIREEKQEARRNIPARNRNTLNSSIASQKPKEDSGFAVVENRLSGSRRRGYKVPEQPMFDVGEGTPGELGSTVGRLPGAFKDPTENGGTLELGGKVQKAIPEYPRHHTILKDRKPVPLRESNTLTGLKSQSLVIKPGKLRQGLTYVITVTARSKDRSWMGRAMTSFTVNTSPSLGHCTIEPASGVEMVTEFRVFCKEWQSEHKPLQYEVSYNVRGHSADCIVYRGLQSDVTFTLPAGDEENEFKVNVSIAILDSLGAKTTRCRMPIQVMPADDNEGERGNDILPEKRLLEELLNPNGSFAALRDVGDTRMLKVLVRYMAMRLNKLSYHGNRTEAVALQSRHGDHFEVSSKLGNRSDHLERIKLRIELRSRLSSILFGLPYRNELEVLQTMQALVPITDVWSELDRQSLDVVVRLNKAVTDRLKALLEGEVTNNQELSFLAVRVASNIVHAVSEFGKVDSRDVWFYNRSLVDSIAALDGIMKTELSFHATGEEPLKSKDSYITTIAARYNSESSPELRINNTLVSLRGNLEEIIQEEGLGSRTDEFSPNVGCIQFHLAKFDNNPFTFARHEREKIRSEMCSVHVYTCDGRELPVTDLKGRNSVHMEIPRLTNNNLVPGQHLLMRSKMNVHRFNVTRANLLHSFHLHLDFDGETKGRLFPISLLLGFQYTPTPYSHVLKWDFADSRQIRMFIKAGYFNASGEYHLGVVDTKYNAGRRREGEVTSRNYTLKIWWTECLYWNQSGATWSGHGCRATENSTFHLTHCECNHLSSFGTFFDGVASSLVLVPVEDFFPPYESPIAISLIGAILCVYAVLMYFCHKADLHDARKGGISYLQDNSLSDHQHYEITIETGFRKGAGTTAKISIILHGEEGMSETRELISDDDKPLFERNSRDKFIMTLPDSIGKIWKVQIWHNNYGSSPSWYLSRVIVKDLNEGNVYYFICEKWLAVEEDDGKVEREFMAVEGNLGFRRVFWAKGTQYMADYHLWTSLFTCPSYSPFRRTQRLSVCLTLLFLYMCLNTLVYNQLEIEYRGEFGLLDLSWSSVTIGVICSAMAIPCYVVLAAMFRRSKLSAASDKDLNSDDNKDDQQYPSGKPNEHSHAEDEDEDDLIQPIMTYSLLDQSILNWPSIQDWAQKQWVKRQNVGLPAEDGGNGTHDEPPSINRALYKRVIGSETDQASSGFEDSNSTDPRPQMTVSSQASSVKNKPPSESSSSTQRSIDMDAKKPNTRCFLPFWFQFVAWSLCVVISLGCAIISIWYGFRFGRTKSIMWLQSLYLSIIVCVFIIQPLMVLLAVIYTAVKYRNNLSILDHYEEGGFGGRARAEILRRKKEAGENGNDCEELERGVAARQRSRYLRFARPPQEKQLIEARKKIMKEKKAKSFIRDVVTFFIAFLVVCVIAYGKGGHSMYRLNHAFNNILYKSGPHALHKVKYPTEWYEWCKSTLVDNIVTQDGKEAEAHQRPIFQGSSYIIGDVLLRQLKVKESPCVNLYYHKIPYIPELCRYEYSSQNSVVAAIGPNKTWKYQEGSGTFPVHGRHGTYDNSGYVVILNRTKEGATKQIEFLQKNHWIDRQTRVTFVQFTTYNAPTNLFSSVMLMLEVSENGGVFPYCKVSSSYIFRYVTDMDSFILACELIFVLITIWKSKIEICDLFKLKRHYMHNGWKILELMTCIVSLIYILCYIYRFLVVSVTIEELRSTYYEKFVNIADVMLWDEILRATIGLVVFLVMLKSLRLLLYSEMFALFGKTYRRTRKDLLMFAMVVLVLLLAYSSLGHLLFGAMFASFRDFWSTVFTTACLLTGNYGNYSGEHYSTAVHIYMFMFCVFVTALLIAYVIVFLSFNLRLSRHKRTKLLTMGVQESALYYWETFLLWSGFREPITFSEPDNSLPPEFTMAEIEYQVDELFFRISALSGSHSLPEKPTTEFTDSDEAYGIGDDGISSGGSEIHIAEEENQDYHPLRSEARGGNQDPLLAQLLKLDSIGAEMVSLEREKQLRSHLELEIFRQLQLQRQTGGTKMSSSGSNGGSQGGSQGQSDTSTDSCMCYGNLTQQLLKNNDKGAGKSPPCDTETRRSIRLPSDSETKSCAGITNLCDIQPELSSSSNPDSPEELLKNQNRLKRTAPPSYIKGKDMSAPSAKPLKSLADSKIFRKPELPIKPTFKNPGTSSEISKPSLLNSPALRQLRSSFGAGEKGLGRGGESNSGSSVTTESSSGSEQDAIHGFQRNFGKRNLRKTKSRGKGKGSVNLSASLLDDLEADEKEEEVEEMEEENQ